jgi:hypothetical protein
MLGTTPPLAHTCTLTKQPRQCTHTSNLIRGLARLARAHAAAAAVRCAAERCLSLPICALFAQDPLRLVRALRFASTLDFRLHPSFWTAAAFALQPGALDAKVSHTRKQAELRKVASAGPQRLVRSPPPPTPHHILSSAADMPRWPSRITPLSAPRLTHLLASRLTQLSAPRLTPLRLALLRQVTFFGLVLSPPPSAAWPDQTAFRDVRAASLTLRPTAHRSVARRSGAAGGAAQVRHARRAPHGRLPCCSGALRHGACDAHRQRVQCTRRRRWFLRRGGGGTRGRLLACGRLLRCEHRRGPCHVPPQLVHNP